MDVDNQGDDLKKEIEFDRSSDKRSLKENVWDGALCLGRGKGETGGRTFKEKATA